MTFLIFRDMVAPSSRITLWRLSCEADLLLRKCRPKDDRCMTLPVFVIVNLLEIDFRVFIFGISPPYIASLPILVVDQFLIFLTKS